MRKPFATRKLRGKRFHFLGHVCSFAQFTLAPFTITNVGHAKDSVENQTLSIRGAQLGLLNMVMIDSPLCSIKFPLKRDLVKKPKSNDMLIIYHNQSLVYEDSFLTAKLLDTCPINFYMLHSTQYNTFVEDSLIVEIRE